MKHEPAKHTYDRPGTGGSGALGIRVPQSPAPIVIVCALALAIRLYCACVCGVTPDFSDMAEYNTLAVHGGLDTYRAPLYPLFLRAVYSIFGGYNYRAVFVIQAIIGAITSLFVYLAACRLWNRRAGLIAALIYAIYPHFILYNVTTLTETLGLFFIAVIILVAVMDIPAGRKAAALAVAVGVGTLLKPAFLFLAPGLLATVRRRWLFIALLGFAGLARLYRREHRPIVAPIAGYVLLVIFFSIFKFRFRLLMEPLLVLYASALLSRAGFAGRRNS
jgi:hypothetical protein